MMTTLFFMWGFMTVWNDLLIPRFKEAFTLDYFQAMLVQFAFFGAYAVGSLGYFVLAAVAGDPINRIGYKNGVVAGLLTAAAGSALFYPAAAAASYPFFLVALFVVGIGFTILQIAANPYVTILGPERTASSRLNLSQAFNSFGTTIGPIVGGWLIFTVFNRPGASGADAVKVPYLCFAAVFVCLAIAFSFARLPSFTNPERIGRGLGALGRPHTVLGMGAIFMYVGGEVTVGSAVINFLGLPRLGGLGHEAASRYLSFYWGGLMIGRLMGAFALSEIRAGRRRLLVAAVPIAAFVTIFVLAGESDALRYGAFLALLLAAFLAGASSPQRLLALFGAIIIGLLLVGMATGGGTARWAVLAVGLFCSVMWSNIFSLAIEGLGPLKSQGSSLLVMAILGGAVLPPLQGLLADRFGIQDSFVVPMAAFAYVAFYGLYGYRAGRPAAAGRRLAAGTVPGAAALGLAAAFALAPSPAKAEDASLPSPVELSSGWRLSDASRVGDGGRAVSSPGYAPGGWLAATVPGTVLTSLVDDGVYPEPLYGENNRPDRIPESLCRASYWYRTTVRVPEGFSGRRIWLNFDGINYRAEVWVDGRKAGEIRGAFARGTFDVTSLVEPGSEAAVAVLIHPPPHPGGNPEKTQLAGTGGNGGILSQDGPTFLCTQGWDWIPVIRDRDIGIWQKVWLSATGPVVLEDPVVTSELPDNGQADLTVEAVVRNVGSAPVEGRLTGAFAGREFSEPVSLGPGEARRIRVGPEQSPELHLDHPRLWWPNGYGAPNLYSMRLGFESGKAVSDSRDLTFGIRRITYAVPGSGNLEISVNGVPVMCRGGAWGIDEAMKRSPRSRLEAQIRLHQLANCNMIRNWVGQSTSEDFYDLCDRYGIMVWDEFFEPNPSDSGRTDRNDGSRDVLDVPMYLANVREKVLRFRGHPSIVLWCGRNEGDPAPEAVAAGIRAITSELDPGRLYQPNSAEGRGIRSGGPYRWRTPREYYAAPGPRRGGVPGPASPANLEAFKTELGSVSIPTLEAVEAMMPEKDWNTIDDDWAEHDLCRGAQEGRGSALYPDMLARRYGPWKGLPEFVREAQLANYEAYRAMFEGRFARIFNPCTGVLSWMSNPAQPSFVWQFYSHDLEPNASFFAVQKACEPVHVLMNQADFHAMVVNQTPSRLAGLRLRIRVFDLDGSARLDRTVAVDAAPSAATDAGAIPFPPGLSAVHFVKVELRDAAGRTISDNVYWRALPGSPDDFTALDSLPAARLVASLAGGAERGRFRMEVTLSNPTGTVALMAHVQLRRRNSGARVLPVTYGSNYVSLLPGESRTIPIEASAADLGGEPPLVAVDGWNVTVQPRSYPDGSAIAPNAAALCGPDFPAGGTSP
jgi:fucose permease